MANLTVITIIKTTDSVGLEYVKHFPIHNDQDPSNEQIGAEDFFLQEVENLGGNIEEYSISEGWFMACDHDNTQLFISTNSIGL